MKKILIIIGILAILGAVAFFILNSTPEGTEGESRIGFSIRNYLPFGKSDEPDPNNNPNQTTDDPNQTGDIPNLDDQNIPRLRKISSEPVAGAVIFNTGTTSIVRFVEKGTGNIYEAKSDTTNITRLTNTTIPKIIRAFWLPNGSGLLAQTLPPENEIIETSFIKLTKNTATSSSEENLTPFNVTIGKLPTDIKEISIKPDSSKIFYYVINGSHSDWYVSNPDGTNSDSVASNALTEWLPKWLSGNKISMQTKSSSASLGYSYIFDVSNGSLKKVGSSLLGISVNLKNDGSKSLISSGGSFPELYIQDNNDNSSRKMLVKTLAEKCLWSGEDNLIYCAVPEQIPNGNYPDVWYKGLVSTEDFIGKFDTDNDIYYKTADLTSLSEQKIDAVDMSISPDQTHLIFKNKIDGFLWMLRIEE